ncbi:hypothetical protein ABVK25_003435 [Lepraria finkii]|uniref:Large ribosomal subunit protein mL49 n=1 Tax=Lepraria finkii TaxID=1340010 RepID=A0ABR4BEY6_9LECA
MASKTFMSFLWPLPLPRLTSIHLLQRRISTQPCLRKEAAVTSSEITTPPPPPPLVTQPSPQPKPQPSINLPPLLYHVHRTASQKLPIYHLAKRGGNLHQTRVRKIQGDVERLRDEIRIALGLKEEHVVINRLTGNIIVKGWYKDDIRRFLEDRHF